MDALHFNADIDAPLDPRRQPLQPVFKVFGNIPANWIEEGPGFGGPLEAINPTEGALIDYWVLPEFK